MNRRQRCGSRNTGNGEPCRNPASGCPVEAHRGPDKAAPVAPLDANPLTGVVPTAEHGDPNDVISLPGVVAGAPGMAGDPREFVDLANKARAFIGIDRQNIVKDYWLTSCLHGIAVASGPDAMITKGQGRREAPLGRCAFAGGTSLVSGWGITERYSEDLDMLALILDPTESNSARRRPLSVVTRWAAAAIGVDKKDVTVGHMGNVGFRRSELKMGDDSRFLKIETTVETDGDGLCEPRQVTSLMGRFATPEQLVEYPELGGFTMLCVTPAYTAANKFDALHRRAENGVLRGLVLRGRDLYDLAMIAASVHATAVRDAIPALAERATSSPGDRADVPRPPGGYASGILFRSGTEAQEALRRGYESVAGLIWGEMPSFRDALELAASLDSP